MASSLGVARMDFVEKRGLQRNERTRDKKRVNASNKQQQAATSNQASPPSVFPRYPIFLAETCCREACNLGNNTTHDGVLYVKATGREPGEGG